MSYMDLMNNRIAGLVDDMEELIQMGNDIATECGKAIIEDSLEKE